MVDKKHCTAIVLSAGQGKRMGTKVQKQYIELAGKPIIAYTLQTFQESSVIDDIILVVGEGQKEYVANAIVKKYGFSKVSEIVVGGQERFHSVWNGLKAIKETAEESYVFIHDGARMFVDEAILERGYETALRYKACAAGMPSKDTIKIVDEDTFSIQTPQRKYVWLVQTPQIFETSYVREAYQRLMQEETIKVTDDAMVVEQMMKRPVKLFEGSYENIKITTPEDLEIAEGFLKKRAVK